MILQQQEPDLPLNTMTEQHQKRSPFTTISRSFFLCVLLTVLALLTSPAQAELSPRERNTVFLTVWTRVRDRYFDPKMNGVDWEAVRKKYAPKVSKKQPDAQFYQLLDKMLGELKQSHFGIIPPDAYVPEEEGKDSGDRGGDAEIGVTVQIVEDSPVITRIEEGSPASRSALKTGWILTAIDGKSVQETVTKIRARKLRPVEENLWIGMTLTRKLSGSRGSKVTLTCKDADGQEQKVTVEREEAEGELTKFGELPLERVRVVSKRLPNNIGYVRFNLFFMPILEPVRKAIRSYHDARGIILDLRGNLGGIGALAATIAAEFTQKQGLLGNMKMRQGEIRFVIYPSPSPYTGPLIILTDETSLSTSEILAGGMQESRRALVMGRPSGGMVLPSQVEKLPGGARLQYAFADFKTPKGILLEGRGVRPNIEVTLTRSLLQSESDPTLQAACQQIEKMVQQTH